MVLEVWTSYYDLQTAARRVRTARDLLESATPVGRGRRAAATRRASGASSTCSPPRARSPSARARGGRRPGATGCSALAALAHEHRQARLRDRRLRTRSRKGREKMRPERNEPVSPRAAAYARSAGAARCSRHSPPSRRCLRGCARKPAAETKVPPGAGPRGRRWSSARCRSRSSPSATSRPPRRCAVKSRVGGQVIRVALRGGPGREGRATCSSPSTRGRYEAALAQAKATSSATGRGATNAEDDAKRYADLVEKEYVTREQFDLEQTNAAAARATVAADEAAVERRRLSARLHRDHGARSPAAPAASWSTPATSSRPTTTTRWW